MYYDESIGYLVEYIDNLTQDYDTGNLFSNIDDLYYTEDTERYFEDASKLFYKGGIWYENEIEDDDRNDEEKQKELL